MKNFIEVTDFEDQQLLVNTENILWVRPYETENGTVIYMASPGRNNYPVSVTVKESYEQIKQKCKE